MSVKLRVGYAYLKNVDIYIYISTCVYKPMAPGKSVSRFAVCGSRSHGPGASTGGFVVV